MGAAKKEQNEMVESDENFEAIFKSSGQQVKEITACEHKDRRHYAKVITFKFNFFMDRICVRHATENMVEINMQQTVPIQTELCTHKENVNRAIWPITTK